MAGDSSYNIDTVATMVLVLYIISKIGFSGGNLFYDGFLLDVTTPDRMDRVSTLAYGLGYIGGSAIPLVVFFVLLLAGVDMMAAMSIVFLFTGIWWLVLY